MNDFNLIESLFARLLSSLVGIFSESEIKEVQDFLGAGEYGLALDTVVDIYTEENKKADPAVISLVGDLATMMKLDQERYANRLQ